MDNATTPQKVASLANPTKAAGASLSAAVRPRSVEIILFWV